MRHQDSYSLGAARVLMPHIVAPMDELMSMHTSWDVLAENCKLFVTFGGVPHKNGQINAGGATLHHVKGGLYAMREKGVRFVNVTPTAEDLDTGGAVEWLAIRPNTDAALILALCHTLWTEKLYDRDFLDRCTVGFDKFASSLAGKDAAWAEKITGIAASRIVALAREMAATRTTVSIGWSLQRSHHGEQPFWALVTLACMLGQIGLPGGGFGVGYGPVNLMGSAHPKYFGPTLPQGTNAVSDFIPVARFTDMLLNPGGKIAYNGREIVYPDIKLVYWAGGNPFHHHQDLNRLRVAWRKPETIVMHEQFWTPAARMADIVLPATTSLERDDIGYGSREPFLIAMKKAREPVGEARDDYLIFSELARRMGAGDGYTEGRDTMAWLKHLYELSRVKSAEAGVTIPPFDDFWQAGIAEAEGENRAPVMLADFRADPAAHPLKTPSGKIEIFSEKIASFGYDDCPGHATWLEPIEWLGIEDRRALSAAHAVGPADRQAAQPARPQPAFARHQGQGPSADHHPSRRCDGPRRRRRRSVARVQRPRRLPGGGAPQRPYPPRRGAAVDGRVVRPGRRWIQPAAREARQSQRAHPRHRRLEAESGLHRPDLPGRDRAFRRAGARRDRPPPARVREALTRFARPCYGRVVTAGQPRRTCRRQRRSRAHRHGRSCRPSRGSASLPPPPSATSPGSVWRRR